MDLGGGISILSDPDLANFAGGDWNTSGLNWDKLDKIVRSYDGEYQF